MTIQNIKIEFKFFYFTLLFFIIFFPYAILFGDTTSDADQLKTQIDQRNAQIQQLQSEISQYNNQMNIVDSQAKTLQNTIKSLDLTQKKISTDLNLTNKKINKTELTLSQIASQIKSTQSNVDINKKSLSNLIKSLNDSDNKSTLEIVLAGNSIGEIWRDIDAIQSVKNQIAIKSNELKDLISNLKSKQTDSQNQQNQLLSLKSDLSGQSQAVTATKQEKTTLLAQTKNQEAAFQKLIADKKSQQAQFEQDIYNFESQLNLMVNTSSYPQPKHGILSWPLDSVTVTQLFGTTADSKRLYTSGSHNGVDFRASIGTRVKNVLAGTVVGTGNTDIYPGCYSFGKWVMIKHDNGLSTIYGHLSVISVSKGQTLSTGDLIGFSGNTGYTTGPHLHISLYATQGVRIEQFVQSRGCKQATIPLADTKAYLDPMAYFPKYN